MEVAVYREERPVGTVTLSEGGGWAEIRMSCLLDRTGLFRGFLACDGGELPLGVLAPEEGRLQARRRVPLPELRTLGAVRRGLCRLCYPFDDGAGWRPAGPDFFRRRFRGSLRGAEGALWRPAGAGRRLALPWDEGRPFPLMEAFCFVRVGEIGGRPYAILTFDGDEWPRMPGDCEK